MTARVKRIVERRLSTMPADAERLFHDLDYWAVQHAWKQMREHLNMEHDDQFVIHALRHTFCSRLAQKRIPIQTIQKLAGHRTISVTMRYAHMDDASLEDAMEVL